MKVETLVKKGFISKKEYQALNTLTGELKKKWPKTKVRIFGSKTKGLADKESDVNVLILLPCNTTEEIRRQIIYKIFDLNLVLKTNISPFILSAREWRTGVVSVLPIHTFIEREGIAL